MQLKSVYFVSCDGNLKIGVAANLITRLKQIQVTCPHKINLEAEWPVPADKVFRVERFLHSRLRHLRVRGEWFMATMSDVAPLEPLMFDFAIGNHPGPEKYELKSDKYLAKIFAQRRWPTIQEHRAFEQLVEMERRPLTCWP